MVGTHSGEGDDALPINFLGEMGERARLRRPSRNHSLVLQSLKFSEVARNFKKKKKKKKKNGDVSHTSHVLSDYGVQVALLGT